MASDSDTEEFFDAPEELSLAKKEQDQCLEQSNIVSVASDKEPKDIEDQEPLQSTESDPASHSTKQDVEKTLESPKESTEALPVKIDQKIEPHVQEGTKAIPPPRPVAPPRRKKQQKKEALAKLQQDTIAGQDAKMKPSRPSRPPAVSEKEVQLKDSVDENQPFITVNANATDMDEVIMKGNSLDIVQNRDLDEYKSPTGSKTDIDESKQGISTPLSSKQKNGTQDSFDDDKNLMPNLSNSGRPLSDIEILEQVIVKNLDTGETIPLSLAEDTLPKCTNPLALQIMRLTSEYSSDTNMTVSEDGHLSDSSVAPSVKLDSKRKKLKKFLGKTVQKIKSVADEVKARREETSSSDEEENQDTYYIKMKTHKAIRERRGFEKIQLLQDLSGEHIGAIWVMKFSLCGRLLAAAGQDNIVRVWVLKEAQSFFEEMRAKYARAERGSPTSSINSINSVTSADDDITLEEDNLSRGDDSDDTGPFKKSPFCTYHGHTSDVLDLSWSKNYFMLSSSMDKTVRLWHISRRECLCCFQHVDFVTAICFHPKDDRYFLSGSLDGKIRLWNIPEKKVVLWNEIDGSQTSLITAANFCQNGKLAVVGTYDGRCIFYDTERLKYHTQLTVRSTRGKNSRGRKISGIEPMPGEEKVLITSNDSRVRLYDLKDHSLYCKYRGASNSSSQIKASFSHDGQYIVCGSEDHFVYLWRVYHDVPNVRKDRNEYYESFSAHDAVVTAAVFAPIPSLIAAAADADGKERETTNDASCATGHNCEVLATADWSGCIKLFVNR